LNDVWKYEIEIDDPIEDTVMDYKDLNIFLHASDTIHILGEIKGTNIELKSNIVIAGRVETQ
jgi:cytoskeletal protein CcmA (bactofilin family)